MEKKYWLVLGVGILLTLVAPGILTQPIIVKWLNFSETGQIGDTIGGITAPVVNLLGAILVFLSFREQLIANRQQRDDLNNQKKESQNKEQFSFIDTILKEIKEEFAELELETIDPTTYGSTINRKEKALEAFYEELESNDGKYNLNMIDFEFSIDALVTSIRFFIEELTAAGMDEKSKIYLFKRFWIFFSTKVDPNLYQFHKINSEATKGINEIIYAMYDSLFDFVEQHKIEGIERYEFIPKSK